MDNKAKAAVVFYHSNCLDGAGSAWAFSYLQASKYEDVVYVSSYYGMAVDNNIIADKDVYVLDFSFPANTITDMCKVACTVTVIDHHETAYNNLNGLTLENFTFIYELTHSGAILTWASLRTDDNATPYFLRLIEDRDLWIFDYPDTKAFCRALYNRISEWSKFEELLYIDAVKAVVEEGLMLLKEDTDTIGHIIATTMEVSTFQGFKCVKINCPPKFTSEACHYLLDTASSMMDTHLAVAFYIRGDTVNISLRSTKEGDINCADIAAKLGGGGHRNAAGCKLSIQQLLQEAVTS
jgi:oligoribonuclease NrnB/cAMP/cGMP phosphodiesterase (DHH superfamily)